jgi:PAS domain S-box-containing protein
MPDVKRSLLHYDKEALCNYALLYLGITDLSLLSYSSLLSHSHINPPLQWILLSWTLLLWLAIFMRRKMSTVWKPVLLIAGSLLTAVCTHALPGTIGFSLPLLILAVVLAALFMDSKASLLLIAVTDVFAFYFNPRGASAITDVLLLTVLPLTLVNLLAVAVIRYFTHIHDALYEQLKLTTDKLSVSESHYRSVFDVMEEGVMVHDADNRIINVNNAACRILGLGKERILGKTSGDLSWHILREDGSPFPGDAQPASISLRDNKPCHGIVMGLCRPDGYTRWFSVNSTPLQDDNNGKPQGVVVTLHDITEPKRVSEELQHAQERLHLMVQQMQAHLWSVDTNLLFTYSDGGGLDNLGLKPNEVVEKGLDLYSFFQTEDPDFLPIQAHLKSLRGESVNYLSEWQDRYYQSVTTPMRDKQDNIIGVVGVAFDVTDMKNLEKEQKNLQRQLLQAQKMEAIGQLTGGIAHDFNNILASIRGYTELAQLMAKKGEIDKSDNYLQIVLDSTSRASELVKNMLAFSRGYKSKAEKQDIRPIIEESVKMLRSVIPSSVELQLSIQAGLPEIEVDAVQINQVLVNLCINARDAMEGKGQISIAVSREDDIRFTCNSCHLNQHGDYIKISVQDTGSGISEDIIPHLFEPFFTTKDVGKGTGMGLSVIHGIIHAYEGHITVQSTVDIGSIFSIYLPIHN